VRRATSQHSSRAFDAELRELRARLLAMGGRCEQSLGVAVDAFLKGGAEILEEVAALDAQIDRDDLEIHALIMQILALRSPVADDLRFLATAVRLVTDLERIGDEALNVAERATKTGGEAERLVLDNLGSMATAAREMLHLALDAFVLGDDSQAERVLERDDEVDGRCAAVIDTMTAYMTEHASEVDSGLRAIRVAKYLERIADHATNVAEEVIFMVRGEDVRHGRWRQTSDEGRPASEPRRDLA
jgi:phosphate transport system protein